MALRFYASASFFCKSMAARIFVCFTVININESFFHNDAVSNVNSMVSMVNDTPNVNASHVDAINQ